VFVDTISFLASTNQHRVANGDVARFKCRPLCTRRLPVITWYKDTAELTVNNGKYFVSADNTLLVTSITQKDAAT